MYRHAHQVQALGVGDTLLFDAEALHGLEAVVDGPASYLSMKGSSDDN